jgi:hypothetical protein
MLVNLIIQILGGAIGGNAAGAALKDVNLGTIGNTIVGAIGGGIGGQLLAAFIPLASSANSLDIATIASQALGGGVTGAILTGMIGLIKNKTA